MINETQAKRYCCDDISLIENYAEAVVDSKMWDLHHKAETDEKLSYKELKAQGRYWNRPAQELIFLTKSTHKKLHYDAGTCEKTREAFRKNGPVNSRKSAWKRSKKVYQYSLDGTFIREWLSTMEINRQLGFAQTHICQCCKGKLKSAYGFIWKYK